VFFYREFGDFYIYTNPEYPDEDQSLVRKQPLPFWPKELLKEEIIKGAASIKEDYSSVDDDVKALQRVVMRILDTYPDFSERMKYQYIHASYHHFSDHFEGYFVLDGVEYQIKISNMSDHIDQTYYQKLSDVSILVTNTFFKYPDSYEKKVDIARGQKQPY